MPSAAATRVAAPANEGDAPSFSPLYRQIAGLITRSLQGGEWKPGEAIPSELDLAARYRVSQGTVRKAIDDLAADNLLVRRQGKGTYVATHAEETTQFRFLRLAPDAPDDVGMGSGRAAMARRFLDCRRQRAPAHIARLLGLSGGEATLQVRRLLYFQGRPVVLDDIWLPAVLFKGLTSQRLSAYQGPMYGLFETEFGVRMIRAEEQIRAVSADPNAAALLELPPGTPLLSVTRVSFTYGDRPVEVRRGLYDTRAHHYRNELG
jgi:GntR family transcriptional regulator